MEINIELKGVKELMQSLEEKKFAVMKAAAMSLNRAATSGRATISKEVRSAYTMKAREIKDEIKIDKASMRHLVSTLTISPRTIPLIQFQTKGRGGMGTRGRKRAPVQVMVKRAGGYKALARAFRAQAKFGEGIFVRTTKKRFPIRVLKGPSVAGMVKDVNVMRTVEENVRKKFDDEFNRAVKYALDKGRLASSE